MIPGSLGKASHREGKDTLALGDYSHAEGDLAQAQGEASHAEGHLTASIGDGSHAEGNRSVATGGASHAEGHGTIAKNYSQHVEGIFNKGNSTETVHETGIGTADDSRKNAFELYFDGNVKFPELTHDMQKNGDGSTPVSVNYLFEKEVAERKTVSSPEFQFDLSRETNFMVSIDSDVLLLRPQNMKAGQTGNISFLPSDGNAHAIRFDSFWFDNSGLATDITVSEYSPLIIQYLVFNEDNILISGNNSIDAHLPIQVGSEDILTINNDDDYLVY